MEAKEALDKILMPKSIAVIGASTDPFKWGHMLLAAIQKSGFEGEIYPVNPRAEEILGLKCYANVREVPGEVDSAIVVVPARFVPSVFEDMVAKGVKGSVVITSGFSETGEEGANAIQQIRDTAAGKMRFIGPNCMGVTSSPGKLSALMVPFLSEEGDVAFISQSGGYGLQLYLRSAALGIGVGKFISSGNESDLKGWEYLKYFGEDPDTKLICMYIEGLKSGRRWYEEAKKITPEKPIVVIKVGVTEAGSKAAASHTGSIAGSDNVYEAAFKQAGVIRAGDAGEMFDFIKGLLYCKLPEGPNIGIVSNSGGVAVETADRLIQNGMNVPTLSEEAQQEILGVIPAFGNPKNPVDLTATLDMNSFLKSPEIVLKQPEIHGMVTIGLGTAILKTMFPDVASEDLQGMIEWLNGQLITTYKKYDKPVIVIDPAADVEPESAKVMEAQMVPVYTTPERAADVMGVLYKRKLYLDKVKV
ncbi:MAG: CoA-binding protein [Candidatus Bathyarchaeota archaeon]|nr:MAG: CoA-binding protein [Candidatus Bathyarchaeota archaeon]